MPAHPRHVVRVLASAVALGAGPAGGTAVQVGQPSSGLEKVQQGVGDVGPLGVDMRLQPLDLRLPVGFDAVYRGRTTDAFGAESDYFVRRHGAVSAVFPRSIYTEVGEGVRSADVPPGTVYYIGDLPAHLLGDAGSPFGLTPPPAEQRSPMPLASASDALAQIPFDEGVERLAAQRRADIAAELILRAAAAEKRRLRGD